MTRRTFYTLATAVAVLALLLLGGRAIRTGFAAMSIMLRLGAGLIFAALLVLGLYLVIRSGSGGGRDT